MNRNLSYSYDNLQHDILQVVTSPLDNLQTFMYSVLECFKENIDSYGYLFYQYDQDPLNPGKYITRDPVSINLPSQVWGESWRNSYYSTSIYNPNVRQKLLQDPKAVFTIGDMVTPEEYEHSRNYQELLKPAGIYYSFAVMLKHGSVPLGHLTLSRPKEMGNFSQEELQSVEKISRSIRNRLLDYRKLSTYEDIASLENVFNQYITDPHIGAFLLSDTHRVLFYNDKALEYSECILGKMTAQGVNSDLFMQRLADQMSINCSARYSVFELTGRCGESIYCTSTPCFLPSQNGIALSYLVQLSTSKRLEIPCADKRADTQVLTRRQMEIVHLIADGMSNREIAGELMISEGTVKKHVENIRDLLGASNRIEILRKLNLL